MNAPLPVANSPLPTPQVAAVPATVPFVAPEELALSVGRRDLLRLGANESAFGPAPQAIAAMQAELGRTAWYGDPESRELRAALARRHACEPANVVVASGIDELLGLLVRAYVGSGSAAVTTLGSYPTFNYHVVGFGSRVESVPYRADGTLDLGGLAKRARETGAPLVYVANPDNPSGAFAERDEIARLRANLPPATMLLLDEAYADFVGPERLLPERIDPAIVRLRTFSKAHGLAGARIGYGLASADVVATLQKIRLHYGVNRLAQIAALASLEAPSFARDVVAEVARGRAEYAALGSRLGIATKPSHANFVLFDLGSRARAEAAVAALLRAGVFVRKPGAPPLDGHIRVTVGTPAERTAFAERFAGVLAELS